MIDPTKILEEVFSYFYEDHLIIPFIDKYQFVRSNSCGLNGTTIPMNPFRPFLTVKIVPFPTKFGNEFGTFTVKFEPSINMTRSSRDIDQSNNLIFYFLD